MTLGCDLGIAQISQTYAESMTFTNKISGAGGLTVSNGKAWLYHWQHLNLHVQHGAKMILSIAALLLLVAAPALPDTAMNAPRTVVAVGSEWAELPHFEGVRAGTALDFSAALDAPAGKYGFARNVGGHIEFERLPGMPQRFYGANLCYAVNYLEGDDLRHLVDEFARMGYNIVRFHHYDHTLAPRGGVEPNQAMLARLDALAAAFRERGIYITLDLFTSRQAPTLPGADKYLVRSHATPPRHR